MYGAPRTALVTAPFRRLRRRPGVFIRATLSAFSLPIGIAATHDLPTNDSRIVAIKRGRIKTETACYAAFSAIFRMGTTDSGQGSGGEGVSQSPLKDKVFSIFLDQNPPLELRPEKGISPVSLAIERCRIRYKGSAICDA